MKLLETKNRDENGCDLDSVDGKSHIDIYLEAMKPLQFGKKFHFIFLNIILAISFVLRRGY